jgi:hypothetical protein
LDAGAFAEQNSGDDGAVVTPAATAGWVLRQQRLEQNPLSVGELKSCAHSASINIETHQDPSRSPLKIHKPGLGRNGYLPSASRETGAHSAHLVRCCWGKDLYGVQSSATTRRSVPGAMRSMAGMTFV